MKNRKFVAIIVAILLVAVGIFFFSRGKNLSENPNSANGKIDCSGISAGAIGTSRGGIFAKCGDENSRPIASIAKIITALVTLDSVRNENPDEIIYTIDETDISFVVDSINENGSGINKEVVGRKLSLREMLTGMLLTSSNSLAESLAYHAFGSFANYKKAAEKFLAKNDLRETTIGADASGLDAGTKSTVRDLFEIGRMAIKNEILGEIIAMEMAEFPDMRGGFDEIENTNLALAKGYSGIKTGTTDEAGNCLLFAKKVGGETVIGVILGAENDEMRYDKADEFVAEISEEGLREN